MSRFYLIFQNT